MDVIKESCEDSPTLNKNDVQYLRDLWAQRTMVQDIEMTVLRESNSVEQPQWLQRWQESLLQGT